MSLRTQNYCIRCIRSENLRDMYSAMIFIASQEERVEESIEVVAACLQKLLSEPEPENEYWDRTLQAGGRAYATLVNRHIKSANDFKYLDSLLDCLQKMVTSRID